MTAARRLQRHRQFHPLGRAASASVLLWSFSRPPLASIVAPGFTSPQDLETLTRLTRIILPAQFFHVIGGLLSAALQAQDKHLLPALAPLVYSASIIAGGLIGAQIFGVRPPMGSPGAFSPARSSGPSPCRFMAA